ncbi:phage tail tube protein [Nisaea acidiphila]|uniref:Phage tail tube protein n=1 Tax=Nisaea acidiphila TaxID=1862145 RepID=A0A9J7B2B6_9PROT|nr:phage tail tube protein [Nisaea acidiphila]UUX51805.1 phage tail tube protein [Nisaea acidiphila]
MADSSRTELAYVKEPLWGTTPASPLTQLRFTGESLGYTISTTSSSEVRADRQVPDLIQTGASAAGSVNLELSYGAYDTLIESALFSAWSAPVAISVSDDIAASNASSAFTSSGTDFTSAGITAGQWVKIGGFAANGGENNGLYRVTGVAANSLAVSPAPASDEAAGGLSVTVSGSTIRNGISETSLTLEKAFTDIGQYIAFTGMVADTMDLQIQTGRVLTGSFGFMGASASIGTATAGTGAAVPAPSNPVLNAVNNIGQVMEGGAALSGVFLQSLSVSLANGLRGIGAVGSLGNVDIGSGRCQVTGRASFYFADGTLYEKYLNGTATSLSFRVTDADGNAYVFTLPRVRLTRGSIAAGGPDQDVMADFQFQAVRDQATGATIQIDRLAA